MGSGHRCLHLTSYLVQTVDNAALSVNHTKRARDRGRVDLHVMAGRLVAELPAICQQQGFTSPQAAPCRCDSVGVLTSANSRERMDACGGMSHRLVNGMQGVRGSNPLSSTTTTPQVNRRVASRLSTPPPLLPRVLAQAADPARSLVDALAEAIQ